MALTLETMSPLTVGSVTYAISDLAVSPSVEAQMLQHSGNEFPSLGIIPGATPRCSFKTPLYGALSMIGISARFVQASIFNFYLATFAAGLRQTGANHTKYSLATSAKCFLWIDGFSIAQNGVAMADCQGIFLSSNGTTHPLAAPTGSVALPTLASEPIINTMGPFSITTTGEARFDGATDFSFRHNCNVQAPKSDGDLYPKIAAFLGCTPQVMIGHMDPLSILAQVGLLGQNVDGTTITAATIYLREIDTTGTPATQLPKTTGISLTVARGRIVPSPVQFSLGAPAKTALTIHGLSVGTTHPVVTATAATIP
jgi:hypothetical protein